MKRLLILCTLVALLAAAQTAQAAPFMLGASGNTTIFDDAVGTSVYENLMSLQLLDPNAAFTRQDTGYFDRNASYTFTGVGYSYDAYDANLEIEAGNAGASWNMYSGFRVSPEYSANDLTFLYWDFDDNRRVKKTLNAVLDDFVTDVYVLDHDVTFQLDGEAPFMFVKGTIFFGFSIPGDNGAGQDFIMAAAPVGAVPVPAAAWLFGTGLAGIAILRGRRRA